jgi:hypothetical protein
LANIGKKNEQSGQKHHPKNEPNMNELLS